MLVKVLQSKYSTLPKFGKGVRVAATRPEEEGRIAIVTTRGPERVRCCEKAGRAPRRCLPTVFARIEIDPAWTAAYLRVFMKFFDARLFTDGIARPCSADPSAAQRRGLFQCPASGTIDGERSSSSRSRSICFLSLAGEGNRAQQGFLHFSSSPVPAPACNLPLFAEISVTRAPHRRKNRRVKPYVGSAAASLWWISRAECHSTCCRRACGYSVPAFRTAGAG